LYQATGDIMAEQLIAELQNAINEVKLIETGDDVTRDRFHGHQGERLEGARTVAWQKTDTAVSTMLESKIPEQIRSAPAVQKKLDEIKDEERKAAVIRTLAEVVNKTDYSYPYPQLLVAGNNGIGMVDIAQNIIIHEDPPALWDPRIWFSKEQIDALKLDMTDWNPVYWDQETSLMDPREVEADIRKMYGDNGLKLTREVMLFVALQKESQMHLNEMDFPMRVPVVMMEIWGDAVQSTSFADFVVKLQVTMQEQYSSESYILGRQYDTPLDGIVNAADGILSVMSKVGLINSDSKLFSTLKEVRADIKKGWSVG
jgi:hypothetical protein